MSNDMKIVLIIIAFLVVAAVGAFRQRAKGKKQSDAFLQQNPNAIKFYIEAQGRSQMLDVPKANGELPLRFKEKGKKGIYLAPDVEYELNLLCEMPNPGGIAIGASRRSSIYTEVLKMTPEPQKTYELRFDDKMNGFTIRKL